MLTLLACGGPEDTEATSAAASGGQGGQTDQGGAGGAGQAGQAGEAGQAGTGQAGAGQPGAGQAGQAGQPGSGQAGEAGVPSGKHLRVVAANASSGTQQSYDPGHGLRILDGLSADVVLIQELNYGANDASAMAALADQAVGPGAYWFREATGDLPNGILSRYPILEAGSWDDAQVDNRGFAWARIDVPGPIDLWAVSIHLLTSSSTKRESEAAALVSFLAAHVPQGDLLAVGGDLNTSTRDEPCIVKLSSLLFTNGPYPADGAGNDNTNAPRSKPHDWVLVDGDLMAREIPVTIGDQSFAHGLVFDTRVYTPLSDVPPALADDSAAAGMQHMIVVRDFALAE